MPLRRRRWRSWRALTRPNARPRPFASIFLRRDPRARACTPALFQASIRSRCRPRTKSPRQLCRCARRSVPRTAKFTISGTAGFWNSIRLHDRLSCPTKTRRGLLTGSANRTRLVFSLRAPLEGIVFLTEGQTNRGSRQAECFAERIQQVTLVGVWHGVGARTEYNKARRPTFRLRNVVEAQ